MLGQYMRNLMEVIETHTQRSYLNDLQNNLEWLENNPEKAKENIKHYTPPLIADNEDEVNKEYKKNVTRVKNAIKKWQDINSNSDVITKSIPINPMNKKTNKTIGGGRLGKMGSKNEVMQWLQDHVPTKANTVAKSLRVMEELSPDPITWTEAVATVDDSLVKLSSGFPILTPSARVLIIGETAESDEIRFMSDHREGPGRMSIVNGKMYAGSNYTQFVDELKN